MSKIHRAWSAVGVRAWLIRGIARNRIDPSMETSSTGPRITTSPSQARRPGESCACSRDMSATIRQDPHGSHPRAVGRPSRCTHPRTARPSLDAVESLGAYLKSRRDRVTPADVGLRTYGTARRVPGLRREELAQLAGVSAGYYTRLEQGQAETASAQVLDALARVLQLDPVETVHLHNLARQPASPRLSEPPREEPHPRVLALLDSLDETTPALVLGRRCDVLAWNRAGHALKAEHIPFDAPQDPARRPSIPRMVFLDQLTRDLTMGSDEFAMMWATGEVADCTVGTIHLQHPTVGAASVDYQVWLQP